MRLNKKYQKCYSQFRSVLNSDRITVFSCIPKSMKKFFLQFSTIFYFAIPTIAQEDYTTYSGEWMYTDYAYLPEIKTVQLHPEEAPLSPPFISLSASTKLECSFDDLSNGYRDYYFTLIHCTHDWQPSDLHSSEYLKGFQELNITDVESSFNTKTSFTHYRFDFPNEEIQLALSGNYLLLVYEDGDKEKPVFTRRFVVYEELVRFASRVKEATIINDARFRQEVDVTVVHPYYPIVNPYSDFHLVILQNARWDNAITDLDPVFVKNNELVFDHDEENNFDGGNEYRWVDLKSLRVQSDQVGLIQLENGIPHAYLLPDPKRTFAVYRSDRDINGRFLIRNSDGFDDNLEADYVMVHFELPVDEPFTNASVYVSGEMSMKSYTRDNRMYYDSEAKSYKLEMLLKQGYYNYQYLVKENDSPYGKVDIIEGSHFSTENQYAIFAYNLEVNRFYDRVVGAIFTDSFNR